MPLVRLDLIEGREKREINKLLDVAHEVIVKAFNVPEGDRYQIVTQHPAYEMKIEDTGLGFSRSKDLVVISITSKHRTEEEKVRLYKMMAKELSEQCGIEPTDIMISLVANGEADWSFGFGEAQFLTGKL